MKNPLYKFLSSLSEVTELPLTEICKEFSVSMSGNREMLVNGVKGLSKYEPELIAMQVCRGNISVYGKELELKSYQKTVLCIRGEIEKIELLGDCK